MEANDPRFYWKDARYVRGIGPFDTLQQLMIYNANVYSSLNITQANQVVKLPTNCPVLKIDFINKKRL